MTTFDRFLQRIYAVTEIRNQNDLARALKINRSAITQAKRKDTIPERWVLALSRTYALNPDWIETGRGAASLSGGDQAELTPVPKVKARLSAGGGSFVVQEDVEAHFSFQTRWLRRMGTPKQMVLMSVYGNSMEPELKDGDMVLVDRSRTEILSGAIYAVGIHDSIMVKRMERHLRQLVLISDNPAYAAIVLHGAEMTAARIIGKVVWVCREYR